MRAIVLDDRVTVQESRPAPNPGDGEVIVRVTCAGICETDLQLIKGYMGFRGVLDMSLSEWPSPAHGRPPRGRRDQLRVLDVRDLPAGLHTHCPNRTVLGILNHDGAFADLIAVPQRNLHAVPDSLSDEIAVFTEPVAAAFQIPAQISIGASDRVIVLGDGRLGNLCAQVLARLPVTCWSSASIRRSSHVRKRSASDGVGV